MSANRPDPPVDADAAEPAADDPLAALRAVPEGVGSPGVERLRALLVGWPAAAQWGVAGVTLLLIGVVAAVLLRPDPPEPESVIPMASTVTVGDAAPSTTVGAVVAHAAGAVARPGVYELGAGARVRDLLSAAGGATPDADLDRLNLAGPVGDGQRVWVPRLGEPEPPDVVPPATASRAAGEDAGGDDRVDVNSADVAELETLPGIGPTTAAAIVDHREANGPFRSVDELRDVRGIGEAKLEQLRDRVSL